MSDWIEWHGGDQPVADDVVVAVRTRTGYEFEPYRAHEIKWVHDENFKDIIAYRIVSQDSELDRLRNELEALKADIETYVHISSGQATENESLRKENAALREALREFAGISGRFAEPYPEKRQDYAPFVLVRSREILLSLGDDAARAALQGAKDD